MVKPSKTMQPEAVNVEKAGRSTNASFGQDSFRNYMARKISMQRQQFGVILPPPPESQNTEFKKPQRRVSFSEDVKDKNEEKRKKSGIQSVLKRLKRRHGSRRKRQRTEYNTGEVQQTDQTFLDEVNGEPVYERSENHLMHEEIDSKSETPTNELGTRKDLFFRGVVVMVNGYTDPDAASLQRMLHKHGGDLEKYETSRITHIIAEHLSTAKANIYKKQRKPTPVCYPSWIVESVKAQRLLPYGPYIIQEVRESCAAKGSIAQLFYQVKERTTSHDGNAIEKPSSELLESSASNHTTKLVDNPKDVLDKLPHEHFATISSVGECPVSALSHEAYGSPTEVSSQSQDTYALMVESDGNNISIANCHSVETPSEVIPVNQTLDLAKVIDVSDETDDTHTRICEVTTSSPRKESKYINGRIRTVGTDPDFLESFFSASRLSFIGSFKQRTRRTSSLHNERGVSQQRYVFHVDMDCFFAAVALRKYPQYRDKPVVISHFGLSPDTSAPNGEANALSTSECATCNYHARKYGITKGMYLGRAKQLCPDLVVLKYDFDGYEEVSEQVTDILEEQADLHHGNLEQVSCDEAFLEIFLEVSDESRQNVASIAETIRTTIFEVTGCTATVGVAPNKFLAKLATDKVKPNRSFVADDPHTLLRELRLRDLHGIGYKLERKLEEEQLATVQDVWDLGNEGESELIRVLGPGIGRKIWLFCQGIDDRPLQPAERKTIGAECNYGVRFNGPYGVDHMMRGLAKEVEKRMSHVGVKGYKITLKLKQRKSGAPPPPKFLGHGSCHNLSRSCEIPSRIATRDREIFFSCGMKLFDEMNVNRDDVRGMGLVVSKLVHDNPSTDQLDFRKSSEPSILNFLKHGSAEEPSSPIISAQRKASKSTKTDEMRNRSVPTEKPETVESSPPAISAADFDIEIPSLSQLHLSQVNQLPSPMKHSIFSNIEAANKEQKRVYETDNNSTKGSRFLQTDMRRMMKLAAVKYGDETIPGSTDIGISMTQLESLPLGMQLQIVNDDNRPLGLLPRKNRNSSDSSSGRFVRPRVDIVTVAHDRSKPNENSSFFQGSFANCNEDVTIVDSDSDIHNQAPPVSLDLTKQSFYQENVKPLMVFMDKNDGNNDEAIRQVLEFFHVVVSEEERHLDAMVLLRSIKRRGDAWSVHPFELIYEKVNSTMRHTFGHELDRQIIES